MGKKLLLKLKISKYNADNHGSSINVSEFTVCEDLMQQFDATSSEVIEIVIKTDEKSLIHINISCVTSIINFTLMCRIRFQLSLMISSRMGKTTRTHPPQQLMLEVPKPLI